MAKALAIKSSILGEHSQSGKLIDEFVQRWQDKGSQFSVQVRDLADNPVPQLDHQLLAGLAGAETADPTQRELAKLSCNLIDEVKEADVLVIGVPMYNFGIPSQLKSWVDLICRAGITFQYTPEGVKGLLEDKPVLLVTTTGGKHRDQATDLALAHMKTVMGFLGLDNVSVAYAEALNMGPESQAKGLADAQSTLEEFVSDYQ